MNDVVLLSHKQIAKKADNLDLHKVISTLGTLLQDEKNYKSIFAKPVAEKPMATAMQNNANVKITQQLRK